MSHPTPATSQVTPGHWDEPAEGSMLPEVALTAIKQDDGTYLLLSI